MTKLSDKQRSEIIRASLKGATQRRLARRYNVSKSLIGDIVNDFKRKGKFGKTRHRKPGSKRPRKTTAQQDDSILELAEQFPFLGSKKIAKKMEPFGVKLSGSTVRRRLHVLGQEFRNMKNRNCSH